MTRSRGRVPRLTGRVFTDLSILMVGLGLFAGVVFPAFVVLLGVPSSYAYTPPFIAACLLAGYVVGACNHLLVRAVLGRTLRLLSRRLQQVGQGIDQATMCATIGAGLPHATRIPVDSDDEIGQTAAAFNQLLDALEREQQFRSLIHNASDIIVIIDRRGVVRFHTPSLSTALGYPLDEVLDASILSVIHPGDKQVTFDRIANLTQSPAGTGTTISVRVQHRDGSWRSFEAEATNLLQDPHVAGIVFSARDITDRVELAAQLERQALYDPLTGLANRGLFLNRVEHAVAACERMDAARVPTVLFIDLDDFKTINDSLGHVSGDELLVAVAERLSLCLRRVDTAARLGGDEFAILIQDAADPETATSVAQRILEVLALPLSLAAVDVAVSASIGIARADGTCSAQELLRNADVAMYAAKSRGKNRFELFDSSMHQRALHRLGLKADLNQALERQELFVAYQPIVDLRTGDICGFEALLRWQHPERGLISPLDFIWFAEETGLIVPIGKFVLDQACAQARLVQAHRSDLGVSVNVSGAQLRHPGIVDDIASALANAELPPECLTVELTESVLMHDTDATIDVLHRIKALGVRVAVDDFGTGYSSLGYLRRFPVDVLKIDRSFVMDLGHGANRSTLTRGIVNLARSLHVETVAEGIEDADQLADLRTLECNLGQGYYFARPLTAAGLQELLQSGNSTALPAARSTTSPLHPT